MKNLPWRAFVVGLLLAAAIGYALLAQLERAAAPSPAPTPTIAPDSAASPPESPAPAAPPTTAPAPAAGEAAAPSAATAKPLAPFATLELSRANFPASGHVIVTLDLGAPSADDSPRPVRMFSVTDQRGILTDVSLDATRTVGTLRLDPSFLLPGEYFVEVQTTEQSAFPLRRYAIVVR